MRELSRPGLCPHGFPDMLASLAGTVATGDASRLFHVLARCCNPGRAALRFLQLCSRALQCVPPPSCHSTLAILCHSRPAPSALPLFCRTPGGWTSQCVLSLLTWVPSASGHPPFPSSCSQIHNFTLISTPAKQCWDVSSILRVRPLFATEKILNAKPLIPTTALRGGRCYSRLTAAWMALRERWRGGPKSEIPWLGDAGPRAMDGTPQLSEGLDLRAFWLLIYKNNILTTEQPTSEC